jgi:hypothetical protein
MVVVCLDRQVALPDVPKFYGLMMAAQQAVLLIGIIVNISDTLSCSYSEFFSKLKQGIRIRFLVTSYNLSINSIGETIVNGVYSHGCDVACGV